MMNYKGEHLMVSRGFYTHHGIGDNQGGVIHYSGFADALSSGPITRVTLEEFVRNREVEVKSYTERKYSQDEAVKRAEKRLGENGYSLFGNNCEHFAEWCITGNHSSDQVDRGVGVGSVLGTAGTGYAATAVVASQGAVAGLSGSGIMSGLAAIGRLTGAATVTGASASVAGLATLAGSGGLGMALLMNNTVLEDDETLPEKERESRQAGRIATYMGAVAGTAGGIVAVSAAGTTAGLSAAGITSGLAAIGGTMAAGTAIVAAAPVVGAAAIGYGTYKLWKWLRN